MAELYRYMCVQNADVNLFLRDLLELMIVPSIRLVLYYYFHLVCCALLRQFLALSLARKLFQSGKHSTSPAVVVLRIRQA